MLNHLRVMCGLLLVNWACLDFAVAGEAGTGVVWRSDYHATLDEAEAGGKLALLWFVDPTISAANEQFRSEVLDQERVATILARDFVTAALAMDAEVVSEGKKIRLLEHPAFAEMRHSAGIAIIDMRDEESLHFRHVVSVLPFEKKAISAEELVVLFELPAGSLTQRSLIYAVRMHPERPASARSGFSLLLAQETEKHADHQASITLQGHHNWEQRFHAINAQLPGGLVAQEVCAESWPGQNLMEAAIECVHSWRQSSGHWEAVSGTQSLFAYDMKRGRNGVWYGVGIFARRH